ncbi:CtsR family transcriptional regulator [Lacticaseibacillus baoqingensis]|uniref:Transcriptional regulator CtsR n=1 Tax=Lacticaseibacillus baoqingensis TaxID=2486013 RepID=A0ABW4E5L9_9LACO|nr:CtsR family transcriptional regulator [Lacticaseibacillus baoqingensis]
MANQNVSDVIEQYLKALLEADEQVEIRRAAIAEQFNCVPSQINYVIKTRFTPERGYVVESKRGGGGYIRILKVKVRSGCGLVEWMIERLPRRIREEDARVMIQKLYDEGIVERQTGNMMLSVLSRQTLNVGDRETEEHLRARLMLAFLQSLQYER